MDLPPVGGHMVWMDPELQAVVVARWLDPAHHARFIAMMGRALQVG
jgi:hypothetical protein